MILLTYLSDNLHVLHRKEVLKNAMKLTATWRKCDKFAHLYPTQFKRRKAKFSAIKETCFLLEVFQTYTCFSGDLWEIMLFMG